MNLSASSNYSGKQFAIFRIVFGSYLLCHFTALLPYAEELFGSSGVLGGKSPFMGAWLNPLFVDGWQHLSFSMISLGVVASFAFTLGRMRRTSAIYLWFLTTCLFTANPLIANPSIAYVGLLLLVCAIVPLGEPFVFRKPGQVDWKMPAMIPITVWVLLAVGYAFSGVLKLSSPSWIDGSALRHVLENPLARPNVLREWILALPDGFLTAMTWGTLMLEILFLPLIVLRSTRRWTWLVMLVMHFGIITVIDFADLSLGMVMVHVFTFQSDWVSEKLMRLVRWLKPLAPRLQRSLKPALGVLLATLVLVQCSSAGKTPHHGIIPFSLMEKPVSKYLISDSSAEKMQVVASYTPEQVDEFHTIVDTIQPGDVITFFMTHKEARQYLRKRKIQKIPYELFSFGHVALVVPDPESSSPDSPSKLLQVAMKDPVNTNYNSDYLKDKSWLVYRPPIGSVDLVKLREFVTAVDGQNYDYAAALGISNRGLHPDENARLERDYSCTTLIVAALHYSGYELHTEHRFGLVDVITPKQVVTSYGNTVHR